MWSPRLSPSRIRHVSIRVRDIRKSTEFYRDLLGFEPRPGSSRDESTCYCCAPGSTAETGFGIVLIQGLPAGADLMGVDRISFEVPAADDVTAMYHAAVARGTPATPPRVYGGFYQTFLFDPDGYKIEVLSGEAPPPKQALSDAAFAQTRSVGESFNARWSQRVQRETNVLAGNESLDGDSVVGGRRE